MKIFYFTTGFFPVRHDSVKASEYFTYKLAKHFSNLGNEVHVFGAEGTEGPFIVHKPKTSREPVEKMEAHYHYYPYVLSDFLDCIDLSNKIKSDIVHDQTTFSLTMAAARYSKTPIISTMHGLRPSIDLKSFYEENDYVYNVAPSEYVRKVSPALKIRQIIPHGIDVAEFKFSGTPGDSFLSIGRMIPQKGQLDAIRAADFADVKLIIGGYPLSNTVSQSYFEIVKDRVKKSKKSTYVGKVPREKVSEMMGKARAFLMPIDDGEAFGLVMIEAMACGTPVIAYDSGPVKEIIKNGINGFVVPKGNIKELTAAIKNAGQIDRFKCHEYATKHFSFTGMAKKYEALYKKLSKKKKHD